MLDYKPGCLVRSLAGHDKGRYFIILKEDGEYVALADGRYRTIEKPKRKKKKHLQLAGDTRIDSVSATDAEVRTIIKRYERSHCGNEEVKEHVKSRCD